MFAASNVVYWWTTRTARECSACLHKPQTSSQMIMLSFSCSYFNITHPTWVRDNGKNWSLATLAGFCTTVFQVTKGNWSQLGDTGINDFWDQLVSFSGFLVRQKCLISVYSTPRFKCKNRWKHLKGNESTSSNKHWILAKGNKKILVSTCSVNIITPPSGLFYAKCQIFADPLQI